MLAHWQIQIEKSHKQSLQLKSELGMFSLILESKNEEIFSLVRDDSRASIIWFIKYIRSD